MWLLCRLSHVALVLVDISAGEEAWPLLLRAQHQASSIAATHLTSPGGS